MPKYLSAHLLDFSALVTESFFNIKIYSIINILLVVNDNNINNIKKKFMWYLTIDALSP